MFYLIITSLILSFKQRVIVHIGGKYKCIFINRCFFLVFGTCGLRTGRCGEEGQRRSEEVGLESEAEGIKSRTLELFLTSLSVFRKSAEAV